LTGGASKRRLRVRRRRKRSDVADRAPDVAEGVGSEVVAEFGCCAIEAVGALSIIVGLLLIPTYLLLS
jgi:hypothetical protein